MPVLSSYLDGMRETDVVGVAAATNSKNPEVGLAAVASLRALVEVLEALQVDNARANGWTWQAIAEELGVTRQAVHEKYAGGRIFRRKR
jgi:hypothetical protein